MSEMIERPFRRKPRKNTFVPISAADRKPRPAIRRRRPGPPRRGRLVDPAYLVWMHEQPGVVGGGKTATVHHIRECGSPKNDRRALPMEWGFHQQQEGPESIESLGKTRWQELHGVNIELAIVSYQKRYLEQHPGVSWEAE